MHLVQERWAVTALTQAPDGIVRRRRPMLQGLVVASGVVLVDQLTKTWVLRSIGPADERHIVGSIRLVLRFNRGAAFSLGDGSGATAWLATAFVALLTGWCVHSWRKPVTVPVATILGLILGGAVGNQLDRLLRGPGWNRGFVIDFVDVGFWPVWNLADAALSCGCVALVLHALWHDRPARRIRAADPHQSESR